MKEISPNSTSESKHGFCALKYRRHDWEPFTDDNCVILLVAWRDSGTPQILIHPEWREFVLPKDIEYLEGFWKDLRELRFDNPELMCEQLANLVVGPLATAEKGLHLSDHHVLEERCRNFVEL